MLNPTLEQPLEPCWMEWQGVPRVLSSQLLPSTSVLLRMGPGTPTVISRILANKQEMLGDWLLRDSPEKKRLEREPYNQVLHCSLV